MASTSSVQTFSQTQATANRMELFESLVKTYEKPLYQFAYRLCGNHHEAQDLLQEGLYRAYKSFARFEAGTAFDRWLYQIIHNLYIDHYRKKRNRPLVSSMSPIRILKMKKPWRFLIGHQIPRMKPFEANWGAKFNGV